MSDQSSALPYRIVLADIDIPFWRMVTIILKWSLASIPAVIILMIILSVVGAMFGGLFAAITGHIGGMRI